MPRKIVPALLQSLGMSLLPVFLLQGMIWIARVPFSWIDFWGRWVFILSILLFTTLLTAHPLSGKIRFLPSAVAFLVGSLSAILYYLYHFDWAAWAGVVIGYSFLTKASLAFTHWRTKWERFGIRSLLSLIGSGLWVSITQIETRFSEEEFFVLLTALIIFMLNWLIFWVYAFIVRVLNVFPHDRIENRIWQNSLLCFLFIISCVWGYVTTHAYQRSFYPTQAPGYSGISRDSPFLCGEVPPDPTPYTHAVVQRNILTLIEANPSKGCPDYGLLAIVTGESTWANQYRDCLLNEARLKKYAEPANSVKSIQYDAALNLYFFSKVSDVFQDLFSQQDQQFIRTWFAEINKRALTTEWVDWFYALALTKKPQGLYENQENGAGLLALLETQGLAQGDTSRQNRDYLDQNPRGWLQRFRNSDDALLYQATWINNAYFQSLYTGKVNPIHMRLSYEWLLIQSIPSGASVRYNHIYHLALATSAYQGAVLLGDERFAWLAGRSSEYLLQHNGYLTAQPGLEKSLNLNGVSPTVGACLVYGDSGLPNQLGPLAPDKVVLRDSWSRDALFLLLNLRFVGWHRYKATNTISLFYQQDTLVEEKLSGRELAWLPAGRRLARDKRIPRQDLNGLVVERSGLDHVLYKVTGLGSSWAQDPPYYAQVQEFQTEEAQDYVRTTLKDWHGWNHYRDIYFYHGGPVVVMDIAQGPAKKQAALLWHVHGSQTGFPNRFQLGTPENPVQMVLFPDVPKISMTGLSSQVDEQGMLDIQYQPELHDGHFSLITVFLTRGWADAKVHILTSIKGYNLRIIRGDQVIEIEIPQEAVSEAELTR